MIENQSNNARDCRIVYQLDWLSMVLHHQYHECKYDHLRQPVLRNASFVAQRLSVDDIVQAK